MDFKSHLKQGGAITAMQLATTLTQFPIGIAVAAIVVTFILLVAIPLTSHFL